MRNSTKLVELCRDVKVMEQSYIFESQVIKVVIACLYMY